MKEQRLTRIADYIAKNKDVSMKELQCYFRMSMNTIRSDVAALTKKGIIEKVYGGVRYCDVDSTKPITERFGVNTESKRNIAKAAAELVQDGDILYLDYGTTVMLIPDYLTDKHDVTIITPNICVVTSVVNHSNLRLIVLPGEFEHRSFGVVSENTIYDLSNYNCTKAFMACTGISKDGMVSSTSHFQKEIKTTAMKRSEKHYLLAEYTKFNDPGLLHYSSLEDFDCIITNDNISQENLELLKAKEISYHLV